MYYECNIYDIHVCIIINECNIYDIRVCIMNVICNVSKIDRSINR